MTRTQRILILAAICLVAFALLACGTLGMSNDELLHWIAN